MQRGHDAQPVHISQNQLAIMQRKIEEGGRSRVNKTGFWRGQELGLMSGTRGYLGFSCSWWCCVPGSVAPPRCSLAGIKPARRKDGSNSPSQKRPETKSHI